jgi:hypothetical protein
MGGGATGKRLCLSCRLIIFFLKIEAFKRKLRVNHSSILLAWFINAKTNLVNQDIQTSGPT